MKDFFEDYQQLEADFGEERLQVIMEKVTQLFRPNALVGMTKTSDGTVISVYLGTKVEYMVESADAYRQRMLDRVRQIPTESVE